MNRSCSIPSFCEVHYFDQRADGRFSITHHYPLINLCILLSFLPPHSLLFVSFVFSLRYGGGALLLFTISCSSREGTRSRIEIFSLFSPRQEQHLSNPQLLPSSTSPQPSISNFPFSNFIQPLQSLRNLFAIVSVPFRLS